MPNHITNIITIASPDEGHKEILQSLLNDENEFDFDMWIKMPECIKDFNPSSDIITAANRRLGKPDKYQHEDTDERIKNLDAEHRADVDRAVANYKECGVMYWYDWTWGAWGTKWPAYDQCVTDTFIQFDTAWSTPEPIILKMSAARPDVTFKIEYADEDIGSNCGTYYAKAGEIVDHDIAPDWNVMDEADQAVWQEFAYHIKYPDDSFEDYLAECEE